MPHGGVLVLQGHGVRRQAGVPQASVVAAAARSRHGPLQGIFTATQANLKSSSSP